MENAELEQKLQFIFGKEEARQRQIWFQKYASGSMNIFQELEMRHFYVDAQRDSSVLTNDVQLHSHGFYEILCCTQGNIQYLLGSSRYRISPGAVIFIPPGIGHRPLLTDNMPQSYDRYVLWLSKDYADQLTHRYSAIAQLLTAPAMLLRTQGEDCRQITQIFIEMVREEEQQKPDWEAVVLGCSLQLLALLCRLMLEDGRLSPTEAPELLDQILHYIDGHLSEKITRQGTAKHFLVSESTISQLFRQKMGTSFYHCVTQHRLIHAKARIAGLESLENVAHAVGFGDYSSFYRAFKREYGITPEQYRQTVVEK